MKLSRSAAAFRLLLLLACLAGLIISISAQESENNGAETSGAASKLTLPKIFEFTRFKEMYKRDYTSVIEEIARQKLYLARAFRAFISSINYKWRRSNFYLAINEKSDWTHKELKNLGLKPGFSMGSLVEPSPDDIEPKRRDVAAESISDEEDSVADLEEIEEKLANDPAFKAVAKELIDGSIEKSRKKRDLSEQPVGPRKITLDDLMKSPELDEELEEELDVLQKVPSNNPDYVEPEMMSFASGDSSSTVEDDKESPMDKNQAEALAQKPSGGLVGNLFGFIGKTVVEPVASIVFPIPWKVPEDDGVTIDHRDSKCLLQAKNQARCGSCYAFATIALYEWAHCMDTGDLVAFSEQYLVDCGSRVGRDLDGCDGAYDMSKVGKFVRDYGIELASNYGYIKRKDECPYPKGADPKTLGYLKVDKPALLGVNLRHLDAKLRETPIVIALSLNKNFHEYGGGVDDSLDKEGNEDHAMLLIGKGVEEGIPYYLLRNSHGISYGLAGHYKIGRKAFFKRFADNVGLYTESKFGTSASKQANNPFYNRKLIQRHRKKQMKQQIKDNSHRAQRHGRNNHVNNVGRGQEAEAQRERMQRRLKELQEEAKQRRANGEEVWRSNKRGEGLDVAINSSS